MAASDARLANFVFMAPERFESVGIASIHFVLPLRSVLEFLDGFSETLCQLWHLVAPEQQQDDQQNQHHFSAAEIRQ